MDTTRTLLELLRSKYAQPGQPVSDYRLAKLAGVSKSAMVRYMRHKGGMSNEIGARIADELGLPHEYVLICLAMEREQFEHLRPVWKRMADFALQAYGGKFAQEVRANKGRKKVAAVLLATGITALLAVPPSPARASQDAASVYYGQLCGR